MSLSGDLLEQAKRLARQEPRRPRQASLRRAVSAAYYALFHLLTESAARYLVGGAAEAKGLRQYVQRAFNHGEMKDAAAGFADGTLPKRLARAVPSQSVPTGLRQVAQAFVTLQGFRHEADYDLSRGFARSEVNELVEVAEKAFEAWKSVRKSTEAKAFLVALLTHRRLRGR